LNNIFAGFLALALALAMIMPAAAPALADYGSDSQPQFSTPASLMIKSPNTVEAGQTATVTVFSKHGHEAVAGALVYVLKTGGLVIGTDAANYTALLGEYEALAEAKGTLFGTTGSDGTVKGNLSETGRFMLVATKDGYIPGFARLTVTLAARTALNIKAPGSAEVNKPVTISVTGRYTGHPIAKAAVYGRPNTALNVPPVTAGPPVKPVQPQVTASSSAAVSVSQPQVISATETAAATVIKADPSNSAADVQLATQISMSGILLGYTDDNGRLIYTFPEGGYYLLTAIKENYIPGFAKISVILADQKKLAVRAPASADAGRQVTLKAVEVNGGQPVEKAAIYAFRPGIIMPPTIQPMPAPADNGTATAGYYPDPAVSPVTSAEAQILISENKDRSFLIGYTNSNGEVQFAFKDPGLYALVAVKDGYLPGGARINIKGIQPSKALEINALFNISAGQSATLKVWEKGTNQPVATAAVYVLKTGDSGDIKAMPPTANNDKAQNGKGNFSADVKAMPPTANNDKAQGEANRAREKGALAGYTDENGQVVFTFSSSGQYVLAAFKDGYIPAFSHITYTLPVSNKSLTLTAPAEAYANAAVNIGAYDAGGVALGKVGIYSLRMDVVAQAATALQSAAKPDAAAREKYGPILREKSSFLGYTDGNGQLNVKFPRSGAFMLLAIRDGYLPDFAKINIKPAPPPVPVPVPLPTPVPPTDNATITE